MSLITVNTSLGVWIYIIHRLPFYIRASLKVIPQKGNDADNIVLFHDTSVYVIAAGGSGGGLSSQPSFDSAEKNAAIFSRPTTRWRKSKAHKITNELINHICCVFLIQL